MKLKQEKNAQKIIFYVISRAFFLCKTLKKVNLFKGLQEKVLAQLLSKGKYNLFYPLFVIHFVLAQLLSKGKYNLSQPLIK